MSDAAYRDLLAATLVWEAICLLVLVIGLLWLRRSLDGVRAGSSSRVQVGFAGALVVATALVAIGSALFAAKGVPWLVQQLVEMQAVSSEAQLTMVDQPAPPLEFSGVADDRAYRLEEFRGDVLLVNFWATWCPPCRHEMPDLERLQRDRREDGLVVIHLSEESRGKIRRYLEEHGLANLHAYAESSQWPAFALPTTYVVDREGVVRSFHIGGADYGHFAEMIEPYF